MSEEELEKEIQKYIKHYDIYEQNKRLQQENQQLKEQLEILLEDNNQLEEIRIKAIECIKNRNTTKSKKERFMSGETTLEKVSEILGEKENE